MGTRSIVSDIEVTRLHALPAAALEGYPDRPLHQYAHQRTLVLLGASPVRLRLGSRARCLSGCLDGFLCAFAAPPACFSLGGAKRGGAHGPPPHLRLR